MWDNVEDVAARVAIIVYKMEYANSIICISNYLLDHLVHGKRKKFHVTRLLIYEPFSFYQFHVENYVR